MFMGEFKHSIDDKGRVILPAKLRDKLGERVVISRGLDPCLYVYTMEEWEKFVQKLDTLPLLDQRSRKIHQYFMSGAVECDLDKQGRIVVPPNLRSILGEEKELTLVGEGRRIEIWSDAVWTEHISEIGNDLGGLTLDLTSVDGFKI